MTAERKTDPYLDQGMHGFIRNTAVREFWRVAALYDDVADLVQDGYLCYAKCRARYVDKLHTLPAENPTIDDKRQMMAAVRTTFERHVKFVLPQKIKDGWEVPVSQLTRAGAEESADPWDALTPPQPGPDSLVLLLCSLPAEIQQLIPLLLRDMDGMRFDRLQYRKSANGSTRVVRLKRKVRETTNQYYCRLLGLDPSENDIAGQVSALRNT